MKRIKIREATTLDAALIADISRETFYETFASQNSVEDMKKFMNEQFTREKLIAEVSESSNLFFLAFADDTPAGYAKIRGGERYAEFNNRPSVEIARIYATTASIGKGIGSSLMQKCIDTASSMKKEIIWLGVWEKNQRAIDFYTKWGFQQFGTHTFLLGSDPQTDWLMMKVIS